MLEYINIVFKNFKSRKLRSFLTLLGIIIGIVSIILLYSFANSIEDVVSAQFDRLGTNRLLIGARGVMGGPPRGAQGLTEKDVRTVESVRGIDYAVYYYSDSVPIKINNKEMIRTVSGYDTRYLNKMNEQFDITFSDGKGFQEGESGNVVVIGSKIPEIFDTKLYAKNVIKINDKNFRIIGILEESGDMSQDTEIRIPIDSMRDITNTKDEITGIMAMILPGIDIERVGENVERQLKRARGDENFLVVTPTQIKESAQKTIGVVKLVVLAIAAVSIIVGGLGIMNSMYTSVLERTKEIGIMKAIGAKNNDVLSIFLLEAGLLGMIGGILSLFFSFLVIQTANLMIAQFSLFKIVITLKPEIAIGSVLFAMLIGIVAGLFPAYRAMKLKPVDALRYE